MTKNQLHFETAFFVQARMGSSRLPEKVLLPFFETETILGIIIKKLKTSFPEIPIVICTSVDPADDAIEAFCNLVNVNCFRGSNHDVLNRFIEAASHFNVAKIIRICADNPLLDMDFLGELISYSDKNPGADYYSFKNRHGLPVIKTHLGLFCEIVSADALRLAYKLTSNPIDHEHVTIFVYSDPRFKICLKPLPPFIDRDDLRFTIDDIDDFELVRQLYSAYLTHDSIAEIVKFADSTPEVKSAMQNNIRKYSK